MANTIFSAPADVTTEAPAVDTDKDFLSELVGEDKPYKDVAALAKATYHKELTIAQRERELAGLRQELATRNRLEEIADRLSAPAAEPLPSPPQPDEQGLRKTEDIQKLIADGVASELNKNRAVENRKAVVSKLRETLGENYPDLVRQKLASLGFSDVQGDAFAAENPKAFFALLGVQETPRSQPQADAGVFAPPRTQISPGFAPQSQSKNWQHYENMRTSADPKVREKYWSPSVQNEIHREALKSSDPEKWFKTQ